MSVAEHFGSGEHTSSLDDLQAFTKAEVAKRLRTSPRSVDRLIASGELKPLRASKHGVPVRIPAGSLRAYLYGAV